MVKNDPPKIARFRPQIGHFWIKNTIFSPRNLLYVISHKTIFLWSGDHFSRFYTVFSKKNMWFFWLFQFTIEIITVFSRKKHVFSAQTPFFKIYARVIKQFGPKISIKIDLLTSKLRNSQFFMIQSAFPAVWWILENGQFWGILGIFLPNLG